MKTTILFLFVLTAFLAVQCKKKEEEPLSCENVKVGEVYLMPESKQFADQFNSKKLIFKDSDGHEITYSMQTYSKRDDEQTLLRIRCSKNWFQDYGDYIVCQSRYLTFSSSTPFTALTSTLTYNVFTISEGLPPDTIHYDVLSIGGISLGSLCPLSKRGVPSRKDLALGNQFIGNITLLGKPFTAVYKNVNHVIMYSKNISSISVQPDLNQDDIYFTAQQGVVAVKYKNDKLWVLDRIE